jgi:hypothetical protein
MDLMAVLVSAVAGIELMALLGCGGGARRRQSA